MVKYATDGIHNDYNFVGRIQYEEMYDNYKSSAVEWVELVKDTPEHIQLQHILVIGDYVVKHWRQDWIYEPTSLMSYDNNNTWNFTPIKQKFTIGKWEHRVYQVDDSPR